MRDDIGDICICGGTAVPTGGRRPWRGAHALRGLLAFASLALCGWAQAVTITYVASPVDLSRNQWVDVYTVSDASLLAGQGFQIDFQTSLYADLRVSLDGGPDWDVLVLQPDPELPARGIFDAMALRTAPDLSGTFGVLFTWLGPYPQPGAQTFEIYDLDFQPIGLGTTVSPVLAAPVPEPSGATLLGVGLLVATAMARRRRRLTGGVGFAAGLALLACAGVQAAPVATGYMQIGVKQVTRTLYDYTFLVTFNNPGAALKNVVGTVTSTSAATVVIDGSSVIGSIAANEYFQSADSITVRQDRTVPFKPAALQWQFSGDVTNHPPVASAVGSTPATSVGQLVTFDGSASSDADGDPLSFSWAVLNAPAGSTTLLTAPQSARTALRIDRAGRYQVQLIVNDGKVASLPTTVSLSSDFPSHAPAWLSMPAGTGSAADSAAYYANQPFNQYCWGNNYEGGPPPTAWTCAPTPAGAPSAIINGDWQSRLGADLTKVPQATFYDNNSLAVARSAGCAAVSAWQSGPGVGCLVTNHGPLPGDPGFPNPDAALADAVAKRAPTTVSSMWASLAPKVDSVAVVAGHEKCIGEVGSTSTPLPTTLMVHPGDVVTLGPAGGSIWAGNLLFGNNGPDGIGGYKCIRGPFDTADCPLANAPLFGLALLPVAAMNADGTAGAAKARFLGSATTTFTASEHAELNMCVNSPFSLYDTQLFGANGSFNVPVSIRRAGAVTFQAYQPGGGLLTTTRLDSEGSKQVPQTCVACHGGQWDPRTKTVTGASMLPFVPADLKFSLQPGATRADQEAALRELNKLVLGTRPDANDPNDPIAVWIRGTYANFTRTTADDTFVPPGWSGDAPLYRQVARPYCLSCHQAMAPALNFASSAQFRAASAAIRRVVCDTRSMPHAEPALIAFRQSDSFQALRQQIFGGADCTP